jgi:hypothetical protein
MLDFARPEPFYEAMDESDAPADAPPAIDWQPATPDPSDEPHAPAVAQSPLDLELLARMYGLLTEDDAVTAAAQQAKKRVRLEEPLAELPPEERDERDEPDKRDERVSEQAIQLLEVARADGSNREGRAQPTSSSARRARPGQADGSFPSRRRRARDEQRHRERTNGLEREEVRQSANGRDALVRR